jgi:hypothetical protein
VTRLALVLLVVAACSSKKAEPPAKVAVLSALHITVDGKPFPVDRAFIKQASPDVHTVTLGTAKGSCTEDGNLGFTLTKRLAATGHDRYFITDIYSRDFDPQFAGSFTAELADTKVTVKATTPKLTLDGTFDAIRCPPPQPTGLGTPKMTHKSTGTITVAGKLLEIKGVTVQARAGVEPTNLPDIVISTNLKDCSSVTLPAPVILARKDGKWTLRGTYFNDDLAETESTLAFNANNVGKSPDGPTIELQLTGAGKLGDYTVKLAGTAEAIECVH